MDNKSITRKEFITLTFTLIGSTALVGSSCGDDDDIDVVTTGAGGRGGAGGGTGAAGQGGGAGSGGANCAGSQLADNLGHVHTLTVSASILSATTAQTVATGAADGHTHNVILSPANLSTLNGGGSVTVTSELADGHVHMYMVTCS